MKGEKSKNMKIKDLKRQIQRQNVKKQTKGITLIALVITIIVLLILAAVSIATLTGENGILTRANEAKTETEEAKEDELRRLTALEAATNIENTEHTETITQTGTDGTEETKTVTVTIPAGFAVSQVEGENTIEDGLVIIDSKGNEFVWVPVDNVVASTEEEADVNKAMAINLGTEQEPKYRGILYDFIGITSSVMSGCTTTEEEFREPAYLTNSEKGDNNLNYNKIGITEENLQNEYNSMIINVIKYGGFYVGRYETSLINNRAMSIKNVMPASADSSSANMWYGLYRLQRDFSTESVRGSMIWGSQWDAMLNWILQGDDKYKVTETEKGNHSGQIGLTGSYDNGLYKINNIYDLEGNMREWTLEAYLDERRVTRGGIYNNDGTSPSSRRGNQPYLDASGNTSRMTLYIK